MAKYELTDEHRAQLGPWADRWIANALKTGPYSEEDRDRCRKAVADLYRAADLEPPRNIVFCASPISAAKAAGIAAGVWWLRNNPNKGSANAQDISQAIEASTKQVETSLPVVRQAVGEALAQDAESEADGSPQEGVSDFLLQCCKNTWSMRNSGNHWSGWVSYLTFFKDVVKLPLDYSKFEPYAELATFGPRYMHEQFCIISEFPEFIRLDAANLPHFDTGPFCRWVDGHELYYWHGVQVPSEWITDRASLDPATALTWPNIEQRRCAAEILGWDRVLEHLGSTVVDEDKDPEIGTLLKADLPDAPGQQFLRVKCGTGRIFVLPVPPDVGTALEANAWTYGLDKEQQLELEVRT